MANALSGIAALRKPAPRARRAECLDARGSLSCRRRWRASSTSSSSRCGRSMSRCPTARCCRPTSLSASSPISSCGRTGDGRSPTTTFSSSAPSMSFWRSSSASRSPSPSTSASRAKRSGERSFSIRSRSHSSLRARYGAGCIAPTRASNSSCAVSAGTISPFASTTDARLRDLRDHRHRRLAVVRICDGPVSRRPALGRSGSRQGGADRRRGPCPHLSQSDPALDRADLRCGCGRPAAIRHQDLRSCRRADGGGPGIATTFPAILRLRPHVPARADRHRRGRGDHDAARRSRSCSCPTRSGRPGAPIAGPPMADATFDAALDPQRAALRTALRRRPDRRLRLPRRFRPHLSPTAVRHRRQFVSRAAGDRAQRTDRVPAKLLAQGLAASVGALLRRRHVRRHPAQFFQFADHDHPGDDLFDAAWRDQRLRALEMALSGIGVRCSPA